MIKQKPSFIILTVCYCAFLLSPATPCLGKSEANPSSDIHGKEDKCYLTPAQKYAAEILSYLLQVVLGRSGHPKSRDDWKKRGLTEKLDLWEIHEKMTDPEKNMLDVMVMDANILDLNRVLYYYDKRLSLEKGGFPFSNLYPAAELLGIRLLLLQKIHRGEKINLKAFIDRGEKFLNKKDQPTQEDLDETNLNAEEMRLVLDIIESEPHLYGNLKCPFLVKSLYDAGAVERDEFSKGKRREAHYKKYPCRHFGGSREMEAIKISILPSMIKEFYHGKDALHPSVNGFQPTEFFNEMTIKLKNEILTKTKTLIYGEINKDRDENTKIKGHEWERIWARILHEKISFFIQDERPLVIYPDNARQVIQDACPGSDLSIILLGKNVYLSIHFDKEKDVYPQIPLFYIDIMDIKHAQIQEETDHMGRFIYSRLRDYLRTAINPPQPPFTKGGN